MTFAVSDQLVVLCYRAPSKVVTLVSPSEVVAFSSSSEMMQVTP